MLGMPAALAQTDTTSIDLRKEKRSRISAGLGASVEYTNVNHYSAENIAFSLCVSLDSTHLFGIVRHLVRFNGDLPVIGTDFRYYYAGIYYEYHVNPWKNTHFSFGCLAGKSRMKYLNPISYGGIRIWTADGEAGSVVEPNVSLNFQLSSRLRFQTRASYRIAGESTSTQLKGPIFNNYNFGVGMIFKVL